MSQISWEGLHCTWRQAEAIGKSCVCFATRAPCHDVLPCFASLEVFQLISIVDLKAKVCHVLYVTISDIYQLFWPFWVLEHMHCLGMCPNVFLKAEVLRWTKHAHNFKGQPCALPPSVVILTWSRFSAKPEPTKTGPTSGVLLLCLMLAALVILKLPDCCAKHEQMNLGVGSMVSTLVLICNRDMWYERIASRFGCQNSLVDSRSAMYLFFFVCFLVKFADDLLHWGGSGWPWRSDAFVTLWCRTATSMGWRIWCYRSDKDFWWTDGSDGTAKPWNQSATSPCRYCYWYRVQEAMASLSSLCFKNCSWSVSVFTCCTKACKLLHEVLISALRSKMTHPRSSKALESSSSFAAWPLVMHWFSLQGLTIWLL